MGICFGYSVSVLIDFVQEAGVVLIVYLPLVFLFKLIKVNPK